MARPKRNPAQNKTDPPVDKHKARRMAGVRGNLADQLEILASRHATDFTEEVNRAVREYLERFNLWPA